MRPSAPRARDRSINHGTHHHYNKTNSGYEHAQQPVGQVAQVQHLSPISLTPSWIFPAIIVSLSTSIIALCYYMSYTQGHTPAFPYTDITHTARYPPERYIFRIGLIMLGVVMFWNWHSVFYWLAHAQLTVAVERSRRSRRHNGSIVPPSTRVINIVAYLGYLACFAIAVSSACITSNEDMPWTIHVIAASSFFVLTYIAQTMVTIKSYQLYHEMTEESRERFMTSYSLNCKLAVTGLATLVLLIDAVSQSKILSFLPSWTGNACEWILTLFVLLYNTSFCNDWYGSLYTGVMLVQPDEEIASVVHKYRQLGSGEENCDDEDEMAVVGGYSIDV